MSFERSGATSLDYQFCTYGASKTKFRGPRYDGPEKTICFVGGSETFGRYVPHPFVTRVGEALEIPVTNLGCMNAGPDVFLNEPDVLSRCCASRLTVIQVLGAQNLSNRLYTVHPRRNDRFLKPSPLLETIYKDVDFTDFHFTQHMLGTLKLVSPERFDIVVQEIQTAWTARMKSLIDRIGGPVVLLWLSRPEPEELSVLGQPPYFISQAVLDDVRDATKGLIAPDLSDAARRADVTSMIFPMLEAPIARRELSPKGHEEVAEQIVNQLNDIVF